MTSSDNDSGEIGAVSAAVEHRFADSELLLTALTHRSYAAEHPGSDDYERLEFLGDAVLELAVTRMLFDTFPDLKEGELTSLRQSVVSEAPLAGIARDFAIPAALRLGAGEDLSGGREKDSILSDAGEAVLGAVFVDAGYEAAARVVRAHWSDLIHAQAVGLGRWDHKSQLLEVLAKDGLTARFEAAGRGPDHAREFSVTINVGDAVIGSGMGTSKKRAEQDAARRALETLLGDA